LRVFHDMETLISADDVRARVRSLAAEILRDHPDGVHLIGVLKGSFIFLSDLARAIAEGTDGTGVTMDFMAVSSYGASSNSSGQVQLLKDLDAPIQGRDVVIVEDIIDTGLTLTYLHQVLRARKPRRLRTACLLSKPSRRKVEMHVEYVGFTIEDRFVVGYGLDYAEAYRALPFIGVVQT
jgi:hypoxanthine phosphoribosyltransferase